MDVESLAPDDESTVENALVSVSCSMLGPTETGPRSLTGTPTCAASTLFPRLRRRLRCHDSMGRRLCQVDSNPRRQLFYYRYYVGG